MTTILSAILQFINRDDAIKDETIRLRKRRRQTVSISDDIKPRLTQAARSIAYDIEEFCRTPPYVRAY